jgi:hypothetical protein
MHNLGRKGKHNKTKDPEINRGFASTPRSAARVRQDGDSTGDPRTKLGNLFVYAMYCWFLFFVFFMNDTLFKSFSMHLYILSYMI